MKKIILIAAFLIAGLGFQTKTNAQFQDGERFGFFYSSLAPYGSWIELDNGVTVWKPYFINSRWSPYRDGQWIWTSDGWFWDSYEPFGWVVYHYGRWYYDDYYGWIWVPDDQWAPAWVEWRYDNDYIGWAPLPPYALFSINIGIHFNVNYFTPYRHWHFVRYNYLCNPHLSNYYMSYKNVNHFFSKTKYRTNYGFHDGRVVNNGVDVGYIRERTGQDIRTREIKVVSNIADLRLQDRDRNRNEIRTFIGSREEISRGDARNIQLQRAERNSTLETSKLEIGRSRDLNRTEINNNNIRNEREIIPRVEGRNNDLPSRNSQNESNIRKVEPRVIEREPRNLNQERVNRETRKENPPVYNVPQQERRTEMQKQTPPQQQRIERPSGRNETRGNNNSSSGNRERRR